MELSQRWYREMLQESDFLEAMAVDLGEIMEPEEEVQDEDEILGIMNEMEKRFLVLAVNKFQAAKAACKVCAQKEDRSPEEKEEFCARRRENMAEATRIRNLMWELIELRLGSRPMAIRKGFRLEEVRIEDESRYVGLQGLINMTRTDLSKPVSIPISLS